MTQKHIIVAIGRTGMGKSTFGNCLGCNFQASNSGESVTKTPSFQASSDRKYIYLDTPGFSDTSSGEENSDLAHQRRILQAFQQSGYDTVHTVLWFCHSTPRVEQAVQWEAKFIQSLGEENPGDKNIWKNVIIVIKEGNKSEGPAKAAEKFSRGVKPTVKGLYLLDHDEEKKELFMPLDFGKRIQSGYLRNSEVPSWIDSVIKEGKHSENPIKICFLNQKCKKCGAVGDHRLMPTKCHREPKFVHSNKRRPRFHPGDVYYCHRFDEPTKDEDSASSSIWLAAVEGAMAGTIMDPGLGTIIGGLAALKRAIDTQNEKTKKYECCGGGEGSRGCLAKYKCCDYSQDSIGCKKEWACCGASIEKETKGCTRVCEWCGKEMLVGNACTSINESPHEIVSSI